MAHIDPFKKLIEDSGGYVHPDLELLVGDDAEHGMVSLAGIPSHTKSLEVPWSLAETRDKPGVWMGFLSGLGYDVMGDDFFLHHSFASGVMPVIGAANHSNSETTGRIAEVGPFLELYGTTFSYSKDKTQLKMHWNIDE